MSLLSSFQQSLIEAFQREGVQFVVVGGVASVYYGVQRSTGDLDILVNAGQENGRRILTAFSKLELDASGIRPEDFEKQLFLSFGFEPDAIDLMTATPGVNFIEAFGRANKIDSGGVSVPIMHIDDLIKNKESLNRQGEKRHLDAFDLQALKRIRTQRSGN